VTCIRLFQQTPKADIPTQANTWIEEEDDWAIETNKNSPSNFLIGAFGYDTYCSLKGSALLHNSTRATILYGHLSHYHVCLQEQEICLSATNRLIKTKLQCSPKPALALPGRGREDALIKALVGWGQVLVGVPDPKPGGQGCYICWLQKFHNLFGLFRNSQESAGIVRLRSLAAPISEAFREPNFVPFRAIISDYVISVRITVTDCRIWGLKLAPTWGW